MTTLPGEWAPQDGVLAAWPADHTDWRSHLAEAEDCYADLIGAIARFEPVVLLVADETVEERARSRLQASSHPIEFLQVPYDDTWVRDSGPITVLRDSQPAWCDFRFDAWGGKFPHQQDDRLVGRLHGFSRFSHLPLQRFDYVLEGGAIESAGDGTILTTSGCLRARHPHRSLEELENLLRESLGAVRVLWLDHGYLAGDDTDGHIDTLARFADPETIVYQACDDPGDVHFGPLRLMAEQLGALCTPGDRSYRLVPLPLPGAKLDASGERLPAGYANFLILNGAILMPTYADQADESAAAALATAFPDREVVGVDCRALITQGGSLHCATMQLPAGSFGHKLR
ncbi:MAG: agmatine deiminase family protein [Xanthomonadales bacterium]|nr:agmatine deiminase family protein [Xanthomonadales bacterium]